MGSGTAAGTTITNGNYSIVASGVNALLGPKVLTTVTSWRVYADISISKTDGVAAVGWGQAMSYAVTVSNAGPDLRKLCLRRRHDAHAADRRHLDLCRQRRWNVHRLG